MHRHVPLLALAVGLAAVAFSFPAASAQGPLTSDPVREQLVISLNVDDVGMKEVDYLGQVVFRCSVEDLSRDAGTEVQPGSGILHSTLVTTRVLPYSADVNATNVSAPIGWAALGSTSVITSGGQSVPFDISVKTTGAVEETYVRVLIESRTESYGKVVTDSEEVVVKLAPYYAGRILMKDPPLKVGQYKTVQYPFEVTSFNFYPDAFLLNASAPDGFFVSVPPRVVMQPRETKIVNLTLVTSHDKIFDLGTPANVLVHMRSENEPQVVYTAATTLTVYGPYVPSYWWPLLVLGVLAGVVTSRDWNERRALRRGEKGLPRRPRPTPREAAFLKELKRRDPAAWKEKQAAYAALYAARKKLWKERRKEELALEREERRESRKLAKAERAKEAELRKARRKLDKAKAAADKKRRAEAARVDAREAKERRKLEKAAAKAAKKSAKKQGKVDRKREAKEAKARAKLEKQLAKKRKELEKVAAKKRKELERARKKAERSR